jgi:hypothetical protein
VSVKSASVLLTLCICLSAVPSQAGDGWSWNSLNPFAKTTSKKKSSVKKSAAKSTTRAQSASEASVISRMGTGAKRMYTKTADTLTFKKKKPPEKPSSRFSPALGSKSERKKKSEAGSTFGNWFKGDE